MSFLPRDLLGPKKTTDLAAQTVRTATPPASVVAATVDAAAASIFVFPLISLFGGVYLKET